MRITLTAIKADIGSIGGHICPSAAVRSAVESFVHEKGKGQIIDCRIFHTGDDICILMSHTQGKGSEQIHKLAWDAFVTGTSVAKEQGLYGAGQDLLKDSFSGNVKGMGPAVVELEFEERPNEPVILFMADKTDPGAYNLPLYLSFADPMYSSGLILSPKMAAGFTFTIMDVAHTESDKVIKLSAPGELYEIATLLRDPERYVIESITSNYDGSQAVAVSTTRLHNIAGTYTGKDDPIFMVRVQGLYPATGEVLSPFSITPYVAGFMRGSHNGPLMPVTLNSSISYFDGPPIVSGAAFCVRNGLMTEPADVFDHPFWQVIREKAAQKALSIREQGFFGIAMLGMSELEYGGIVEKLGKLEERFQVRHETDAVLAASGGERGC